MFARDVLIELRQWAVDPDRKPLVLRGARQVGKTTAVELFGREFDHCVTLNLEKKEDANIFRQPLSFEERLGAIFFAQKTPRNAGRTLLFIDEVQNSPEAVAEMRYFREEAAGIHVIAAGTLPETMIGNDRINFPVGRVQYLFLYPLNFAEFLGALGENQALEVYRTTPFPSYAADRLLRLFHQYTFIGGMPEVVAKYAAGRDILALGPIYQGLLTSYLDDVSKYAKNATMAACIRHAIETAPLEAGSRIKFQGFGRSNYRSREMGEALKTLERAMLLYLLYPTTATGPPLMPDLKKSPRLQFLDTGLLNFYAGLQDYLFKTTDLHSIYQGRLAEHIVGQEIIALDRQKNTKPVFWVREKTQSSAKVDFLLRHGPLAVPVEVKAGKIGALRSLHEFMERSDCSYAVRLYAGPLNEMRAVTVSGRKYTLLNLPYFLAGRLPEYLDWNISKIRNT